jgi:hypothetical protein
MLLLQWRDLPLGGKRSAPGNDLWNTVRSSAIPLRRPVVIHIGAGVADMAEQLHRLVARMLEVLERMAGETPAPATLEPWQAGSEESCRLEAVLGVCCP